MPIYEYRCRGCQRRFSALVGVVADAPEPACPKCGVRELDRLMSRFASPRSEEARLDRLAEDAPSEDIDDPGAMRDWMRRMSSEMGEEGADLEQAFEEAAAEDATGVAGDDGAGLASGGSELGDL